MTQIYIIWILRPYSRFIVLCRLCRWYQVQRSAKIRRAGTHRKGMCTCTESDPPRNGTSLRSELRTCKKYGQQIISVIKQFKFNLAAVSVSKRSRNHCFSLQLVSALKRAQILWEQATFLSCLLCPVSCPIVCDVALSELFVDESKKTSQYLGSITNQEKSTGDKLKGGARNYSRKQTNLRQGSMH